LSGDAMPSPSGPSPSGPSPPGLALERVRIAAAGRDLFAPLSLAVPAGTVTTVMGPSGSGKSSLLAFVAGTLPRAMLAEGRASVAGIELSGLPPERRRVGLLFQDDLLFPHLSVGENLAIGLAETVRGEGARRVAITDALAEAELEGFAERDPATLSGGQRARVALMRTLLAAPRALLLDEPFGRLDAALRDRVRRFVFEHATARGLPVLLVTHDPADAEAAAGPIVRLEA